MIDSLMPFICSYFSTFYIILHASWDLLLLYGTGLQLGKMLKKENQSTCFLFKMN